MNADWSIKLQVGNGGVQGYNEWELIYKTTQTAYKLTQTGSIAGQAPLILPHISDAASPTPARAVEANKQLQFELSVFDATNATPDWDVILNNIHTLNRHMSGASSTAVRHSIDGTAQQVRIAIKPDGATYTTYWRVLYGFVDVSAAYYRPESQQGSNSAAEIGAWFMPVNLTLESAGEGDSFTLRNDLPSSPGMIEDTNADGFADGIEAANTAPTNKTLTTDRYVIGGKSQFFRVDATNSSGIRTAVVTAAVDTSVVAYAWVTASLSTADILTIELQDGSGSVIDDVDYNPASPAGYDRTFVGHSGFTWYRYVVSGTNTAPTFAANFILVIRRKSTNATVISNYYADALYLQTGTTTAPPAWCSSSRLKNRYDPASTSAATRQQINYLDVWGVPGDLPALFNTFINQTANEADGLMTSIIRNGPVTAETWYHWLDSEQMAVLTGSVALTADATRTKGDYLRWSGSGSASTNYPTGIPYSTDGLTWTNFHEWLAVTPARVYAIGRTSSLSNQLRFTWTGASTGDNGYKSFFATNTWELIDLGLLNTTAANEDGAYIIPALNIIFSSGTLDVDALIFLPSTEDGFMLVPYSDGTAAAPYFYTYGGDRYVTQNNNIGLVLAADVLVQHQGAFWTVDPGPYMNRLLFFMQGTYNTNRFTYNIDTAMTVTLGVTPRTSHLIGTT